MTRDELIDIARRMTPEVLAIWRVLLLAQLVAAREALAAIDMVERA